MDSTADRLIKLREERIAREKARIVKLSVFCLLKEEDKMCNYTDSIQHLLLRELNLKKYSKPNEPNNSMSNLCANKPMKLATNLKNLGVVKNNFHVNGTTKRPISAPLSKLQMKVTGKPNNTQKQDSIDSKMDKPANNVAKPERKPLGTAVLKGPAVKLFDDKKVTNEKKASQSQLANKKPTTINFNRATATNLNRKTMSATDKPIHKVARKSLAAPRSHPLSASNVSSNNSVFERLYKPKMTQNKHATEVEKLQTDPNYLKKVINTTGLILNKRHTVFDIKPKSEMPIRRSISAVHFKRVSKQELGNCIHKWSSIGDKLNNIHLTQINEDEKVKQDKVVSAIKSDRKKVKFMTPVPNFNTPRPEELQARLKAWLQKRGKSLDSYHHLQCFGIHHLPHHLQFDPKFYDDEDKENIAVESDSDNDSFKENMSEDVEMTTKWRTGSVMSDSIDLSETQNTTTTCSDIVNTDEVLTGALVDLTELLREGFDWEQCARWLRAIRERFPSAPDCAAYWECRAALEETRGDLPASVTCWEEAIAKGTEHSVVEANLDQLLDKFMQLKISPNSGKRREVDPKLVDVKNVFKSTIIRFAVQQAKLRQSMQSPAPPYCVTPVRRSGRLSARGSGRHALQECASVRRADELLGEPLRFVPNRHLHGTP